MPRKQKFHAEETKVSRRRNQSFKQWELEFQGMKLFVSTVETDFGTTEKNRSMPVRKMWHTLKREV